MELEKLLNYFLIFLLLGGGSFILTTVLNIGFGVLAKKFGVKSEPKDKRTEREKRTELVRRWARDQRRGGPLKGTPRPLTLDEEENLK